MQIEVRLFASFSLYLPSFAVGNKVILTLSEEATIRDVIQQLKIPPEQIKLVSANGVRQKIDYKVSEGDQIGVYPPVAGG